MNAILRIMPERGRRLPRRSVLKRPSRGRRTAVGAVGARGAAGAVPEDPAELIAACRRESIRLLQRNSTPAGIMAASPGERARRRGYAAIFARDAAICALGMALSADAELEREAVRGLETLAAHQAANGQIPNFVDVRRREADFWYLGCIDATLWWLIALAFLDARDAGAMHRRFPRERARALDWLRAQEHQRFHLLQQNEASDWADIMPRSGFVLYTNALWYHVKRLYRVERLRETRASLNALFHPFSSGLARDRRAQLLADYALRTARRRDLYLSFVNLSCFGEEGDVFGNLLAVLCGAVDPEATRRILRALRVAGVAEPYPIRAVVHPIRPGSRLWRGYMNRHRQNLTWQYHNGGIWPMVGGFWVTALAATGHMTPARAALAQLARACALGNWRFTEWLHGVTLSPRGMPGQSWNAAAFLLAEHSVSRRTNPLLRRT